MTNHSTEDQLVEQSRLGLFDKLCWAVAEPTQS